MKEKILNSKILGYIKSETLVSCSTEELRQGDVPNSQALSRISPVFNSLEETLTYDFDANVEDDRLESWVAGSSKTIDRNLLKRLWVDALNAV